MLLPAHIALHGAEQIHVRNRVKPSAYHFRKSSSFCSLAVLFSLFRSVIEAIALTLSDFPRMLTALEEQVFVTELANGSPSFQNRTKAGKLA